MHPRRRHLLQTLAAAGLIGNIPLAIREAVAAGNKPTTQGIYRIKGTVTLNGKPASEGMLVRPGDTLVTGPGSQAIYVIGEDAYLQRDNSTVNILGETLASGFRMLSGKLLTVFGKGPGKTLVTPTATIGIRGTGCYIEAESSQTYFCLCYGTADITPTASPERKQSITTRHHDQPMLIGNTPSDKMMSAATMANHTDDELELLEALVGRRVPFAGAGYTKAY